ncbi:hypothetical protein ACSLBF_05060 [Pseudoalteromonas sp. T1lg65]|uniref:hypothetical protein n=1 Tax=Pseudoalteromonas sp. T1lg65 TaxID=2077101 RepID=UPI003F793278
MGLISSIFKGVFKLVGIDLEPKPQNQKIQGVDYTAPATDASIPVYYGKVKRTGGTIIYRATSDVAGNKVKNELLHLIIVWGEVNGADVTQIYIDDEPITSSKFTGKDGHRWAYAFHSQGGPLSEPRLNSTGWSHYANRPEKLLYSYVRLEMGAKDPVFTSRPNITADIEQKTIFDVRTGQQQPVASNPALQLYDYLTNDVYGKNLAESEIDKDSFKRAATICDFMVDSYEGGSKIPLYTSNVRLDTSKSIKSNCEMLLAAMRASLPVVNGKLTLVLDVDKPPVAWQANEDTIVSDISVDDASKKDRYNQVTVQYYDNNRNGKLQDAVFPDKGSDIETQWRAEDNGILLSKKIKIDTLNNAYEAKRIAEFVARKSRDQLSIQFTARDDAALLAIGDIVRVSDEVLGFEQKLFTLTDQVLMSNGEVELSMTEHQPSHYNWQPGVRQTIIPDTVYQSYKPEPPTTLQASVVEDSKLKIEWQSAFDDFEYKVIRDERVIKAGDTTQHSVSLALDAGEYEIQIFAVNALGFRSDAASLLFTVDEPAVPTVEITSLTSTSAVLYATTTGASTQTNYEWQFAGEGEQKTVIAQVLTVSSLLPNKRYEGRVRTLNASGKSQWHSFVVKTPELAPYEHAAALTFELSQSPSWLGMGTGWQPESVTNHVRVSLTDLKDKQELAYQTLAVTLAEDGTLYAELLEDNENFTESELFIEFSGEGTNHLTITARHDLQTQRQGFTVTGLSVSELKETQKRLEEMDELANSVLEQALDSEYTFAADLTSTLTLERKTDSTNARVEEAAAAQADENQAIATRFRQVTAEVDANKAQVTQVEQALADKEQALATKISTVQAEVDANKAQVTQVEQALANKEQALATKISKVQAEVDDNKANITAVEHALVTTEQALAAKVTQLDAKVDDNQADIQAYYITKADAEQAVSQAKTELNSKVDNNRAYLDQTFYTSAETDQAITTQQEQLRSEIGNSIARVENNTYTKTEADRAISLQANSLYANFNQQISQLGDTYFSQADEHGALANFVKNVSVTTASGTTSVFQHMQAQASTLDAQGNKINQLEARAEIGVNNNGEVTGMTITPNKMCFKAGVVEFLDSGGNKSVYYDTNAGQYTFNGKVVANSGSFKGHIDAQSGTFRGRVEAESGTFKGRVEATSGSFSGHVEANSGTFKGRVEATSGEISSVTLRSCTWDAGGSSIISANSGMLKITQGGVLNTRFLADGEGFLRKLAIYNNGRKESWGLNIQYHKNGIYIDPHFETPDEAKDSWALYAKNGEIGPHTSAHETLLPKEFAPEPGDILCDDELVHIANISNAICTAKISNTPMDVTARGIYTRRRDLTESQPAGLVGLEDWEQLAYVYDVACINAGGEGVMNVCGEGGNLQTGDLICSSSMPGKGMRQPTQSEERYTIAQVRHNVTFDSPDQVKQVAVIYKRG